MNTNARHYTSPATPPRLIAQVGTPAPAGSSLPPVVCLHCGGALGHTPPRLVSFHWGPVAPSRLRRD